MYTHINVRKGVYSMLILKLKIKLQWEYLREAKKKEIRRDAYLIKPPFFVFKKIGFIFGGGGNILEVIH